MHFKMNKGYHVANFTLPLYNKETKVVNYSQRIGQGDETLIVYGCKSTGKSAILKDKIVDYIKQQLNSVRKSNSNITHELSAIEIQSSDKIVCLLSGKHKEVTEDKNGYFVVPLEDFY